MGSGKRSPLRNPGMPNLLRRLTVWYEMTPAPERNESNSAVTDGGNGEKESRVRVKVISS
jgi:hypothetical protein